GLAQSLPKISSNGRVYKFNLRPGLKYSNGKKVLASDFKWAIKRGFLATGQGVGFYTDIAGAKAYAAHPTKGGNISGIITNNKTRSITIKLATPRGDFLTILALIFAAPVPASTSTAILNGTIPGTGPYHFTNFDATAGSRWCGTSTSSRRSTSRAGARTGSTSRWSATRTPPPSG